MNHNILNKIIEAHIQNRIREREDKIYAYQFRFPVYIYDPDPKIVTAKDKNTLRQIIIKDILKNEIRILEDFSKNIYDKTLPSCIYFRSDEEKIRRVITSDRRIYSLLEDYINKKIEEKAIMIAKYTK